MYLDKFRNLVESLDGITSKDILPCTEDEINQLETEMAVKLPTAYREFLLWCGKKLGRVIWDDRFYYPFHPSMKDEAIEMLIFGNHDKSIISENVIVTWAHEGYSYTFIRTDEGNDPPVYHVMDDGLVRLLFPHFSDYFYDEAVRYLRRYHGLAE